MKKFAQRCRESWSADVLVRTVLPTGRPPRRPDAGGRNGEAAKRRWGNPNRNPSPQRHRGHRAIVNLNIEHRTQPAIKTTNHTNHTKTFQLRIPHSSLRIWNNPQSAIRDSKSISSP